MWQYCLETKHKKATHNVPVAQKAVKYVKVQAALATLTALYEYALWKMFVMW